MPRQLHTTISIHHLFSFNMTSQLASQSDLLQQSGSHLSYEEWFRLKFHLPFKQTDLIETLLSTNGQRPECYCLSVWFSAAPLVHFLYSVFKPFYMPLWMFKVSYFILKLFIDYIVINLLCHKYEQWRHEGIHIISSLPLHFSSSDRQFWMLNAKVLIN